MAGIGRPRVLTAHQKRLRLLAGHKKTVRDIVHVLGESNNLPEPRASALRQCIVSENDDYEVTGTQVEYDEKTNRIQKGASMLRLKTTKTDHGVSSVFTRESDNAFRVISTLYHPNGCYQTAVLNKESDDGGEILGWRLASSQQEANEIHVSTLIELLSSDPGDWREWTTDSRTAKSIIANCGDETDTWDVPQINYLLAKNNLPAVGHSIAQSWGLMFLRLFTRMFTRGKKVEAP